ncbi:MAG: metallophosphoesterase [Candidatus Sumerlaeaceae bacterium]
MHQPTAKVRRARGINSAGYRCPRFNLEDGRLAWLKSLRSAGSRVTALALTSVPRARGAYSDFVPRRVLISRFEVPVLGLPAELDHLRVVQLSDIHHGPWLPIEVVQSIVEHTNKLHPDIVALTGDYVVNSPRYIDPVADALGHLRPRIGSLAVLGNHDWWEGAEEIRNALSNVGIPLIDNHRCFVTPERQLVEEATAGLCIAGVGDAWEDHVDFASAFAGVPDHMPRMVLSHNPDCAEDVHLLRDSHRIDLMLAGHTHGGQVCFPRKKTPMLPAMRKQKYGKGMVMGPSCPVFISRGIGTAGVPVRMGAPPEIAVFTLRVSK